MNETWARRNASLIVTVVTLIVLMSIQWAGFQQTAALARDTDARLRAHEQDTSRHVDTERDERRWADLVKRLDRIEDKIDEH